MQNNATEWVSWNEQQLLHSFWSRIHGGLFHEVAMLNTLWTSFFPVSEVDTLYFNLPGLTTDVIYPAALVWSTVHISIMSHRFIVSFKSSIFFFFNWGIGDVLYKLQMYNTVTHTFKGYTPFIKCCLYSLCCAMYPCSLLILYIADCISYSPTPNSPLPTFLSRLVTTNVFSTSESLFLCYILCVVFSFRFHM